MRFRHNYKTFCIYAYLFNIAYRNLYDNFNLIYKSETEKKLFIILILCTKIMRKICIFFFKSYCKKNFNVV